MMNFKFPDDIIFKRDLQRVHEELSKVLENSNPEEALKSVSPETDSLVQANQQLMQNLNLVQFKEKLDQAIKESPVFDVILATHPHDSFLAELVVWFRKSIHSNSLLNIHVRRSIGGGVVLRSKNKLFDLSLRPRILETKDKIPEVLRNV